MTEVNFKSLQNVHEALLQKQQSLSDENQQDFIKEVRAYIEQAKQSGSNISSTRERDQIRANLRYWANYIYRIDKTFPDTELAPSSVFQERRLWSSSIGRLAILIIGIFIIIGIGNLLINKRNTPSIVETPTSTSPITTSTSIPLTSTELPSTEYTPTPNSTGFNVILSSPTGGERITPDIEFRGTFENLEAGWAIHVFFIKEGKYYPVKDYFLVQNQSTSNEWYIQTRLSESSDELGQFQNYSIILAISLDESSRELLSNVTETGIGIESLPPTIIDLEKSSIVLLRHPFKAIQETRLVYSLFDGTSFDLYTSKPDGSDPIQITNTPDIYESSPRLSPDGTKIVYIHGTHSIHIMDSNGQNDREITNGGNNTLDNPQWSSDSEYLLYTLGDSRQSGNTLWSIHTYHITTGKDEIISGEPEAHANRYSTWLPNKDIIFDTRSGDRTRFSKVSLSSPNIFSKFFDLEQPMQAIIQPNIKNIGDGYLLTYTIVTPPNYDHNIYAVLDSDRQFPFDGSPTRLTRTAGGADYPILMPNSNTIYYVREGIIYKVDFNIEGANIVLTPGIKEDGEYYGDLVVETGTVSTNPSFDINFMDAFFPIQ